MRLSSVTDESVAMNEMSVPAGRASAIGAEQGRFEDAKLVQGHGRYTDDINAANQLWAHIVRSDIAHGIIKSIDKAEAEAAPGVKAVITGADLADYGCLPSCAMPLKNIDDTPMLTTKWHALPSDKVRYVGEAIAAVIATSRQAALDAAELLEIDIDELDPVLDVATADDGPQLHDGQSNVALNWRFGDPEATAQAFAAAHHVTKLSLDNQRVAIVPMEPRTALATYDADKESFHFQTGCQGVFGLRGQLAGILGIEKGQIRVTSEDVGGSFGMKLPAFPEYLVVLHAARALGQPVKWRDERSDSFKADLQGRAMHFHAELALDENGKFLAVKVKSLGDLGAYVSFFGPVMPSMNIQANTPGGYQTPLLLVETICAVTNKTPIGPYRGAGRPEGVYIMERLIDQAARDMNIDRVDLRRRNFIQSFPHKVASGREIDSGDFATIMDAGLEKADFAGFAARRAQSEAAGKLRGIGFCTYLEVTAGGGGNELGEVTFKADGRVDLVTGTFDFGQGHHVTFAQILHDRLGIPLDKIDLVQGDSDRLKAGGGTGGSRSVMASGNAISVVSEKIIERGKQAAGHILEAASADIIFANGTFSVAGTDKRIGIMELAKAAAENPEVEALDASEVVDMVPSTFPNGCHVAEVEIDPETGVVTLLDYNAVDDFGTVINPMLTRGQMHGGIVQGVGQALLETTIFDESGQPLTGSFMDYCMPRADDVPMIEDEFIEVPATTNPLGVKGCGEAGPTGGMSSVMNAVCDALASRGITHIDMPATPERVWRALNQ